MLDSGTGTTPSRSTCPRPSQGGLVGVMPDVDFRLPSTHPRRQTDITVLSLLVLRLRAGLRLLRIPERRVRRAHLLGDVAHVRIDAESLRLGVDQPFAPELLQSAPSRPSLIPFIVA